MILEEPGRLLISKKKPLWTLWLGGSLLLMGLLMQHAVTGVSTLSCQRSSENQGNCIYTRQKLFTSHSQKWPLSQVKKAYITYNDDDTSVLYLDVAGSSEGVDLDGLGFGSTESKDEAEEEKINVFLNSPRETKLDVHYSDWIGGLMFGIPLILLGLALGLFSGGRWYFIFDQPRRKFISGSSGILGTSILQRKDEFGLKDISQLEIEGLFTSNDSTEYPIRIRVDKPKPRDIYITADFLGHSRDKAIEVKAQIESLLGREFHQSPQRILTIEYQNPQDQTVTTLKVDLADLPNTHSPIQLELLDGRMIELTPTQLKPGHLKIDPEP